MNMEENRAVNNKSEGMYFSTSTVVKKTGVTLRQLYYWEKSGIVQPKFEQFGLRMYRRYENNDIELISNIIRYLKEGYNLQTAAQKAKDEFQMKLFD